MRTKGIEDLLTAQVDALHAGRARDWLRRQTTPISAEAKSLFELVHRAHAALKPVEPRPAFVSDLKARLQAAANGEPRITIRQQRQSGWLLVMAGIGGLVSVVSVVFIVARLIAAFFRKVPSVQVARAEMPATQ